MLRRGGHVRDFAHLLENVFAPLWAVTLDPASHPNLDRLLADVVGFDSVDDETTYDTPLPALEPAAWGSEDNPPYAYWMYYMWANIHTLNRVRHARGQSTFEFRPHAGEAGAINHLAACFLVADKINHGVNLRKSAPLQYLYLVRQIGISVSPLSNNALFLPLQKNPFPQFFRRGLNVTLSTDDPLQFHLTQTPLLEEYGLACRMWRLSWTDMCEIARNSVLQSGFSHAP